MACWTTTSPVTTRAQLALRLCHSQGATLHWQHTRWQTHIALLSLAASVSDSSQARQALLLCNATCTGMA